MKLPRTDVAARACLPSPLHAAASNRSTVPLVRREQLAIPLGRPTLAIAERRGLAKAPKSRSEVEGICRAASEDCCNFMAPLAASETRAGEERLRRLKPDVPHDRRASWEARSRKSFPLPAAPTWKRFNESPPPNLFLPRRNLLSVCVPTQTWNCLLVDVELKAYLYGGRLGPNAIQLPIAQQVAKNGCGQE